jgi:5,10-methylenetetrahydromethanopterin reductase
MSGLSRGLLLQPVRAAGESARLARMAEDLGCASIWVADEGLSGRDVFVTMTAIAAATSTAQIGTGLVNPYTRHPAVTASAIATIDELSGGRAFVCFGAGGSLALGPLGVAREHPRARVAEAIEVCRALFAGATVSRDGTAPLEGAHLGYARAGIEIWFAGRSPRLLEHAGAVADGVLLEFLHKPSLPTYLDAVRAGAASVGRVPRWYYSTCVVTDPARLDHIRPHMTYRLVDSPAAVRAQLGITDTDVTEIREAMRDGLAAAAPLVRDGWIEPFVVLGTPDECAAELHRLRAELGFDGFVLLLADVPRAEDEISAGADVLDRLDRLERLDRGD